MKVINLNRPGGGQGVDQLSELKDISLSELLDGQSLVYDAGVQKWVNKFSGSEEVVGLIIYEIKKNDSSHAFPDNYHWLDTNFAKVLEEFKKGYIIEIEVKDEEENSTYYKLYKIKKDSSTKEENRLCFFHTTEKVSINYLECFPGNKDDYNGTIRYSEVSLAKKTDLSSKQDLLVSGENIKTINNETLLGEGNINLVADVKVDGNSVVENNVAIIDLSGKADNEDLQAEIQRATQTEQALSEELNTKISGTANDVSIPNVVDPGTLASWEFKISGSEELSITGNNGSPIVFGDPIVASKITNN